MLAASPLSAVGEGEILRSEYTILIADRNSRVREFLKREMTGEGLRVLQAETGKEVINMVYHHFPLDLVLLDPDLPDMEETVLLKKIGNRIPPLPVVIHAFDTEKANYFLHLRQADFVEKGGRSIENLKQVILKILEKKNDFQSPKCGKSNSD
jgi:DNA-binding NtrC family response regulator